MPGSKKSAQHECVFCHRTFKRRGDLTRHEDARTCHLRQPPNRPLHFGELARAPFTLKSLYRKD